MLKQLKQYLFPSKKVTIPDYMDQHVIDGVTFYTFGQVENLPTSRESLMLKGFGDMDLSCHRESLLEFVRLQKRKIDENKLSDAGYLSNILEANLIAFSNINNLLRIANQLILLEGEPLSSPRAQDTQRKSELIRDSEEIRNFFLIKALERLQTMGALKKDIEGFIKALPQLIQIEDQLLSEIGKNWHTLTPTGS